jgi:hypothetical protein
MADQLQEYWCYCCFDYGTTTTTTTTTRIAASRCIMSTIIHYVDNQPSIPKQATRVRTAGTSRID